jgi:hypothetical protein
MVRWPAGFELAAHRRIAFKRRWRRVRSDRAQTRANWELMLKLHLYPAFGDLYVDAIQKRDVEAWLAGQAKLVEGRRCRRTP